MAKVSDILWSLYQDHTNQGRHHEQQRTAATNLILVVSGAILGIIALDDKITKADLPLAIFLVFLGCFGALLSAKHHERFWFHTERAREYRDTLQKFLPSIDIRSLKSNADERSRRRHPLLWKVSLFNLWIALHVIVSVIGAMLAIAILIGSC